MNTKDKFVRQLIKEVGKKKTRDFIADLRKHQFKTVKAFGLDLSLIIDAPYERIKAKDLNNADWRAKQYIRKEDKKDGGI